jgi:branched-chain amino acid transport system substrate-binding protein
MRIAFTKCFILATLALAACDRGTQGDSRGTEQKVGVVAPLTGEGATYGASMKRGFDLAFEGIPGVRVLYEDSHFQAKDGVAALTKLATVDRVKFVYGEAASGVTAAMVPVADSQKLVLFSSIASADTLSGVSKYFFRNMPRNAAQAETAATYLKGKGVKRVAILNENDEYGVNLAKQFESQAASAGLEIVDRATYLNTDTDFRAVLTRIAGKKPDAVFMPGNYEESGMILRQAREVGLKALMMGGDGSYSPDLIKYAGPAAEGFVCMTMGIDRNSDKYKTFKDAFVRKYKVEPDGYDTYAYEAGLILREALEKGGEDIRGYLASHKFETFDGPRSFSGSDMVRPWGTAIVRGGKFEYQ